MKLDDLAKKANALPRLEWEWGGPEHWHSDVFDKNVESLPDAIEYIKVLKDRMAAQSMILYQLFDAYRKMKDIMLEAEVDP
jgi:hypothetical protein